LFTIYFLLLRNKSAISTSCSDLCIPSIHKRIYFIYTRTHTYTILRRIIRYLKEKYSSDRYTYYYFLRYINILKRTLNVQSVLISRTHDGARAYDRSSCIYSTYPINLSTPANTGPLPSSYGRAIRDRPACTTRRSCVLTRCVNSLFFIRVMLRRIYIYIYIHEV